MTAHGGRTALEESIRALREAEARRAQRLAAARVELRQARRDAGLSLRQVAGAAGTEFANLSKIETRPDYPVSVALLERLATAIRALHGARLDEPLGYQPPRRRSQR